jgi:hypothetical protein
MTNSLVMVFYNPARCSVAVHGFTGCPCKTHVVGLVAKSDCKTIWSKWWCRPTRMASSNDACHPRPDHRHPGRGLRNPGISSRLPAGRERPVMRLIRRHHRALPPPPGPVCLQGDILIAPQKCGTLQISSFVSNGPNSPAPFCKSLKLFYGSTSSSPTKTAFEH